MPSIKNINLGNLNKFIIFFFIHFILIQISYSLGNDNFVGKNTNIKILDKISSKNELIDLRNSEEIIYKDLAIKSNEMYKFRIR